MLKSACATASRSTSPPCWSICANSKRLQNPPTLRLALATLLSLGADDALAVDNYDQAVRYNSRAEDLIPLIKNAPLKDHLKSEVTRVLALKQASAGALAASKILAAKPDDPEASLTAGKFALQKGDFEKAFPLLAKSSDKALSSLAKRELTPATKAPDQAKMAEDWFGLAEKEIPLIKARMRERALYWYNTALPLSTGLVKLQIETRLKSFAPSVAALAPAPIASKTPPVENASKNGEINLIAMFRGKADTMRPKCTLKDGMLICGDVNAAVSFPYHPPSEYDMNVEFVPTVGRAQAVIMLTHDGKGLFFSLGIENPVFENKNFQPEIGKKTKVMVQVRKSTIEAFIDGVKVADGKLESIAFHPYWETTDQEAVGVATHDSTIRFEKVTIKEISGQGKIAR